MRNKYLRVIRYCGLVIIFLVVLALSFICFCGLHGGPYVFGSDEINRQVNQSTDDVWRRVTGNTWNTAGVSNTFADYSVTIYDATCGMRFKNITVPAGSEITNSYIQVYGYQTFGTMNAIVKGEDTDDAATFSTSADYDGRTRTDNYVGWTSGFGAGSWYTSPDLSDIVQEIIDREGWSSGNDMAFFIMDSTGYDWRDQVEVRTYDYSSSLAAKLYIEYSPPGPPGVPSVVVNQTGVDQVTANWTHGDDATGTCFRMSYIDYPGYDGDWLVYQGDNVYQAVNGLDLNSTVYYMSFFSYNPYGNSDLVEGQIGGDELEVSFAMNTGLISLIAGFVLAFLAFFIKSPLIPLAIIPCMVGCLVEPTFKDLWFQTGCVLVMLWAGIRFYVRMKEGGEQG